MSNLIEQLNRLEQLGKQNIDTTERLIAAAKYFDPSIETRDQALELSRKFYNEIKNLLKDKC